MGRPPGEPCLRRRIERSRRTRSRPKRRLAKENWASARSVTSAIVPRRLVRMTACLAANQSGPGPKDRPA